MSTRWAGPGHRPAHPIPVHDGQVTVEHDHVIGRLRGGGQGRRAVIHDVRGDPDLTQPLSDPAGKRRMVLDQQHPHLYQYAPAGMTSVQHRRKRYCHPLGRRTVDMKRITAHQGDGDARQR